MPTHVLTRYNCTECYNNMLDINKQTHEVHDRHTKKNKKPYKYYTVLVYKY